MMLSCGGRLTSCTSWERSSLENIIPFIYSPEDPGQLCMGHDRLSVDFWPQVGIVYRHVYGFYSVGNATHYRTVYIQMIISGSIACHHVQRNCLLKGKVYVNLVQVVRKIKDRPEC